MVFAAYGKDQNKIFSFLLPSSHRFIKSIPVIVRQRLEFKNGFTFPKFLAQNLVYSNCNC